MISRNKYTTAPQIMINHLCYWLRHIISIEVAWLGRWWRSQNRCGTVGIICPRPLTDYIEYHLSLPIWDTTLDGAMSQQEASRRQLHRLCRILRPASSAAYLHAHFLIYVWNEACPPRTPKQRHYRRIRYRSSLILVFIISNEFYRALSHSRGVSSKWYRG